MNGQLLELAVKIQQRWANRGELHSRFIIGLSVKSGARSGVIVSANDTHIGMADHTGMKHLAKIDKIIPDLSNPVTRGFLAGEIASAMGEEQ